METHGQAEDPAVVAARLLIEHAVRPRCRYQCMSLGIMTSMSVLRIPLPKAEEQLTERITVGQALLRNLDRLSSIKLFIPAGWREEEWKRAQQWHDYNCTWLGQNLGNEVREEYRAVAGRVYQAGQPDDVWVEDTLRLILPRDISKLESIRARLPLWTPTAEPAQEPIAEEVHRALLSAHPALLADVLLNWIHTSAGGSPSAMVACDAFEPDIARAAIEDVLRTLESRGYVQLHWLNPTPALPGATLTQSGAVHAESGYKRWRSRVFRDRAARNALLAWLHDEGTQNDPMPLPGFLRDPRSAIDGHFFAAADRDAAAIYLYQKRLIDGDFIEEQRCPYIAWLTADGIDCMERGGNVAEYLAPRSGGVTYNLNAPVSGTNVIVGDHGTINGIDADSLRVLMQAIIEALPGLGLDTHDQKAVTDTTDQIVSDIEQHQPDQQRLRAALRKVGDLLTRAANQALAAVLSAAIDYERSKLGLPPVS